ncbi:MAG: 1-deoxy-D-xylulose 5-phosphate reductoisomerase [Candidatus Paraimprobicoccus trichonymphae]|uniref:1-deoxy-D-xylulose 5-phosphate reductoisomerase n=1 Tax=Candidatus Paraimprobicoccus trichonymphae TaxID=3033793 RepID=A0AA48HX59_9FIRM|nr:MAG: 1-deoxy-D-xylulose 5-phosphate reductoisomerase [Candidatus Paraimprobicoccus trichonymphae]
MIKKVTLLGSTGSIGIQAIGVIKKLNFKIDSLATNKNIKLLEQQIREFKVHKVSVFDKRFAKILKENTRDLFLEILEGLNGLCEIASCNDSDLVLNSVMGMVGLFPTLSALSSGKDVALANKEALVVGGEIINKIIIKNKSKIIPIDSEHSAIFQCLNNYKNKKEIKKLILTASGGPFFGKSYRDLESVSLKQALNHPNWKMGKKITIDSATMMNKGLEIIEAARLFNIDAENIDVIIHRESIIHSMVEFIDNSVLAQMSIPDMKIPIQYALTYPERVNSDISESLNLTKYQKLTFFEPDYKLFKLINICRNAIKIGGTMPVVINSANEKAVDLFLNKKIKFLEIFEIIEKILENYKFESIHTVQDIIKADKITKENIIFEKLV